jgi:putative oxidoreductase
MNKLLWVLQVLLALAFLAHGILFLVPPPEIAVQMNAFLPRWFQLFLGIAEVLAAIGLTVPGVTRIQPQLVPAAAVGILIVTVSATVLHTVRGEYSSAATTVVLTLIAAFILHGRWKRLPITPRSQP